MPAGKAPADGERVRDAEVYVYAFCRVPVPPEVVTATATAPAERAGAVAVIWVELFTVKLEAAVPPNVTAVAPVKSMPVIVTVVPPFVVPLGGLRLETVGAFGMKAT